MTTLFENNDFILKSTGHDYDFVGIIETKTAEPLTFFFSEELCPVDEDDFDDTEWMVDESQTKLLDVYQGLTPYDYETDDGTDEAEEIAFSNGATSWFTTRDDGFTGFLSDCKDRGQFIAIIKAYCPDKLKEISWA